MIPVIKLNDRVIILKMFLLTKVFERRAHGHNLYKQNIIFAYSAKRKVLNG